MIKTEIDRTSYIFEYDIEKRIRALTRHDGLISFMLRCLDIIPPSNGHVHILEGLTSNLRKIRNNLKNGRAIPEQIETYDNKVYDCFTRSISIVIDRSINIDNPYMTRDINLLNYISKYFIIWLSENL